MDRWVGKVAVVTGASAGIGLITAQKLLECGVNVIGLARRKSKMEEAVRSVENITGKFYPIECDITDEEKVIKVFNEIKNKFGPIHILVNNAGVSKANTLTGLSSKELHEIINVNLYGLLYCSREVIKIMKEGDQEGLIINIGSMLGHKVMYIPDMPMNIYPGTKFAVRAISESMQNELLGSKIRVSHVSPGLTKTEIFSASGIPQEFIDKAPALNSEDIADAIIFVISTKPHVNVSEVTLRHRFAEHR